MGNAVSILRGMKWGVGSSRLLQHAYSEYFQNGTTNTQPSILRIPTPVFSGIPPMVYRKKTT